MLVLVLRGINEKSLGDMIDSLYKLNEIVATPGEVRIDARRVFAQIGTEFHTDPGGSQGGGDCGLW